MRTANIRDLSRLQDWKTQTWSYSATVRTIADMGIDPDTLRRQQIGKRLKALREAMGLSQVEMAELCATDTWDITPQEWNNWERGRQRISLDKAHLVVDATGAGLNWIFRADESDVPYPLVIKVKAFLSGKAQKLPRRRRPRGSARH